jgi:hypothetical protein
MRLMPFVACALALAAIAARADAQPPARSPTIKAAWQAPVGHRQPRAEDVQLADPLAPSPADQELDRALQICRGC